ncbi:hypothetical protein [Dokdonia sp. Asnod2-E02]|uniref:hypothetical protein n=1 Tax=Dokdonia sp. Asnod2-E02 TaxID=3160574 RepID=UPI003869417F
MLEPLKEILLKSTNNPLEMEYIIDWLSENEKLYNKIKRMTQAMDLFETDKGLVRLPMDLNGTSEDDQFLEIYDKLTELKRFFEMEAYFKGELELFSKIGDNKVLLQEFYLRNKEVYDKEVFSFFIEYYDEVGAKFMNIPLISGNQSLVIVPTNFSKLISFSEVFEKISTNQ